LEFEVGQKVRCINPFSEYTIKDEIYTIKNIEFHAGRTYLVLDGIRGHQIRTHRPEVQGRR
jgi:hypothetical protein